MKRWSIKKKIIFWYTLFFTLLIGFDFLFINTFSRQMLNVQAERDITVATDEIAGTLHFDNGKIYIGSDDDSNTFNYYHDGVIFMLYQNDQVAYGQAPTDFDATEPIVLNEVRTQVTNNIHWLVYDVQMQNGYVLRGLYDVTTITYSIQQIVLIIDILSPIIVLIAAVGGYFIIKRSFRPIQKIYETAASIKDEEDFSKRIEPGVSKDEVHELAEMVNQMLDRVEQSINREKQFSSNVSHELRTPLTVMQAQAEYMLAKTDNAELKADIETIIQQIQFMESIVTKLLDITRARHLSPEEMETIDLYELIQFTAESFTQKLEEKHLTLTVSEPHFKTKVSGNQTMLIRVFSNLIMNAIKYNKEGGRIDIGFVKDNQNLVVSVSDTGKGIAQEHLEKIFNPFYRVSESRTHNDYSVGLGLSLVQEIVHLHKGDIRVESVEDKGTTFMIRLPLA